MINRIGNVMVGICLIALFAAVIGVCILALFQPDLATTAWEDRMIVRFAGGWFLSILIAFVLTQVQAKPRY